MAKLEEIRGYEIVYYNELSTPYIAVENGGQRDTYLSVPTVSEARKAFEVPDSTKVTYINLFRNIVSAGFPRIPDGGESYQSLFRSSGVVVAPSIPKNVPIYYLFRDCASLLQPAVIPKGAGSIEDIYRGCSSMLYPVSVPDVPGSKRYLYEGCANMTGEFVCRTGSGVYSSFLKDTVKPIIVYGSKSIGEAIAASANNGNASWQPWYDPVPAVTNRGPNSYTTAEDMTRMVRNGALAVNTYAPGRMVYNRGDIVREDEWNALVEAAQTIDPTVTYSTLYSNLNKIEAAFDSAL